MENDVIALPLTRFAARVHKRSCVPIKRAGLPVIISLVAVTIEQLNLVEPLQINPAVPAPLAISLDFSRRRPFHVQLNIRKSFLRHNTASSVDRDKTIFKL